MNESKLIFFFLSKQNFQELCVDLMYKREHNLKLRTSFFHILYIMICMHDLCNINKHQLQLMYIMSCVRHYYATRACSSSCSNTFGMALHQFVMSSEMT